MNEEYTYIATRAELISDLPQSFQEQNNLSEMSDEEIVDFWKMYGTHAGTEDWDTVEIMEGE